MALKTKPTDDAEKVMGGKPANNFEPEAETATATLDDSARLDNEGDTQPTPQAQTPEVVDAAQASASTAIAKAAGTSVTIAGGDPFGKHLPDYMKQMLASLDFGVLPRLIGEQGGIAIANESVDLGKWITGQILQAVNTFIVSPGEDTEEAKKLVKYSKDGKVCDDTGQPCTQYVAQLQAEGYAKAALKNYMSVTILLTGAADAEAAEEFIGTVMTVQLAPESRKRFQRYLVNAQMKSLMTQSLAGLDMAKFTAVKQSSPGRSWTDIDTSINKEG